MEVAVRTNDHHSIVVQFFFLGLGTLIKYENKLYIFIYVYPYMQPIGGLWKWILWSYLWLCDICFPLYISLSILSIKVGGLGYILVKNDPSQRKDRLGLVSLGCFKILLILILVSVVMPRWGLIISLSIHFTLLLVEVPVRTNDHHSIVVQIGFLCGWVLR